MVAEPLHHYHLCLNGICNTTSSFPVRDKDKGPKWNGSGERAHYVAPFFFFSIYAFNNEAGRGTNTTTQRARQQAPILTLL